MIEFKPGSYYLGFWFIDGKSKNTDWLGCVWREENSPRWIFRSRFRYHNPESHDPFDNKDRKSFSNFEIDAAKKTEAQIEEDVGLIASIIGVRFGVPVEFVEVRGDMDKALYRLALQPWAHFQTGTLPTPAEQRQ